jgi:hypothetical protein
MDILIGLVAILLIALVVISAVYISEKNSQPKPRLCPYDLERCLLTKKRNTINAPKELYVFGQTFNLVYSSNNLYIWKHYVLDFYVTWNKMQAREAFDIPTNVTQKQLARIKHWKVSNADAYWRGQSSNTLLGELKQGFSFCIALTDDAKEALFKVHPTSPWNRQYYMNSVPGLIIVPISFIYKQVGYQTKPEFNSMEGNEFYFRVFKFLHNYKFETYGDVADTFEAPCTVDLRGKVDTEYYQFHKLAKRFEEIARLNANDPEQVVNITHIDTVNMGNITLTRDTDNSLLSKICSQKNPHPYHEIENRATHTLREGYGCYLLTSTIEGDSYGVKYPAIVALVRKSTGFNTAHYCEYGRLRVYLDFFVLVDGTYRAIPENSHYIYFLFVTDIESTMNLDIDEFERALNNYYTARIEKAEKQLKVFSDGAKEALKTSSSYLLDKEKTFKVLGLSNKLPTETITENEQNQEST